MSKLEDLGKEFIENKMKYSFNSKDTKTIANRLLMAFMAGADALLKSKFELEKPLQSSREFMEEQIEGPRKMEPKKVVQETISKTQQKVVITNSESLVNQFLGDGWKVKSTTAMHVSSGGNQCSGKEGNICFVLEKDL